MHILAKVLHPRIACMGLSELANLRLKSIRDIRVLHEGLVHLVQPELVRIDPVEIFRPPDLHVHAHLRMSHNRHCSKKRHCAHHSEFHICTPCAACSSAAIAAWLGEEATSK